MNPTAVEPSTQGDDQFVRSSAQLYRRSLVDDVVPFWMRHGIDRKHGGISNMLDDAGGLLGTDTYLWSQGRGLWTFSSLCTRSERRAEWLAFADHIFNFLKEPGNRDDQGRWVFRKDKDGKVLEGNTSIYVD